MIIKNGKRIDGCSDTLPIGTVQPFLGLTPPKGYLLCQGQAVSKITYKELYEICGDTFGTSTETEFYLPDLRGKTIAGYDENDAATNTIGKLLGQKTHTHTTGNHTLTIDEMPAHTHRTEFSWDTSAADDSDWGYAVKMNIDGQTDGSSEEIVGGSQPHNHGSTGEASNYQPTIVMNWIVKAVMTIPVQSSLATSYTDSTTDVYTCDYVNEAIRTGLGDNVPAGTVVDYNGEEIPEGWELAEDYASVYIGPTKPTEGQEVWIQKGKNLFDKNAVFPGLLTSYNTIEGDEIYKTSDFISVVPNTTYYKTASGSARLKFYGKNKTPLSDVYNDIADADYEQAFTTPEGAYYLRLTVMENYLGTLQIEQGSVGTAYEPFIKKLYIKNDNGSYEEFINKQDVKTITVDEIKTHNLFNVFGPHVKYANYNYTVNADGSLYCPSLDGNGGFILFSEKYKRNDTYVLSYTRTSGPTTRPFFRCYNANGEEITTSTIGLDGYGYNSIYQGYWKDYTDMRPTIELNFNNDVAYFQVGFVGLEYTIDNIMLSSKSASLDYAPQLNYGVWSGSTDTGHWIKYADGTLICRLIHTIGSCTFALHSGGLYTDQTHNGYYQWKLPHKFIDRDVVITATCVSSAYMCSSASGLSTDGSTCNIYYHTNYPCSTTVTLCMTAIGRWK